MAETTISWASTVWNPVAGCSRVGGPESGCWNCYAARFAHRFDHPGDVFDGLTRIRNGRVDWSGQLRLRPERLEQPLRWRKPRRIFVDSMSDLYHPKVPFEFIAAVHGVAAACPQHQFLILTKRPERMLEFYRWVHKLGLEPATGGAIDVCCSEAVSMFDVCKHDGYIARLVRASERCNWPLPNVVVGVSAETKAALERRWFYLEHLPPAVRWVSLEPLLGPVDLWCCLPEYNDHHLHVRGVDWVVVGAESGPGARPCKLEWIRSVVRQCKEAGVPVHVKQVQLKKGCSTRLSRDPSEWPEDLRTREYPDVQR